MNDNLKKENKAAQMNIVAQNCMVCNIKVSQKIFYQWSDPTDNIYGFQYIKSHYRIYGQQFSKYPVKMNISGNCYLYYDVLCVDCGKNNKDDRWQCVYCNKFYNKSTTHCKKKKICIYCIEKEVGPHCKCKICNMN